MPRNWDKQMKKALHNFYNRRLYAKSVLIVIKLSAFPS
jgi:hypothetical protein